VAALAVGDVLAAPTHEAIARLVRARERLGQGSKGMS
jgi:hypothetical protein